MHVLVTGAAGFIGSSLVDALLARGDSVTGLDNFDPFYSRAEKIANLEQARTHRTFTLIEGDLLRQVDVRTSLASRPDVVVHLAAKAGVRPSMADPEAYRRTNVEGTRVLLSEIGSIPLVFLSSSSVYGESTVVPF